MPTEIVKEEAVQTGKFRVLLGAGLAILLLGTAAGWAAYGDHSVVGISAGRSGTSCGPAT